MRAAAVLIAVVAATVDQLSKGWALDRLADDRIEVVPTVSLALHRNDGMSFSTGAGNGRVIGLLVIVVIAYLIWLLFEHQRPVGVFVLGVILGGAVGNLWDRLFRAEDGFLTGHVIDFIDVSWFAVFNVADVFVVGGTLVFGLLEWRNHRRTRRKDATPPA